MKLMGAEALLAARHEVKALKPHMQRNMASFHYRPHGDSEILPASLLGAAKQAGTLRLISMVHDAAMRAYRATRPQHAFEVRAGRVVVLEMRL
jgi:hypothetical protein